MDQTNENEIEINNDYRIYFDSDKSNINETSKETLNQTIKFLECSPNGTVVLDGNTDNKGTMEYNMKLGERRAYSAKQYIINKLGSSYGSRIIVTSHGKINPLVLGNDEKSLAKNRRVEIEERLN